MKKYTIPKIDEDFVYEIEKTWETSLPKTPDIAVLKSIAKDDQAFIQNKLKELRDLKVELNNEIKHALERIIQLKNEISQYICREYLKITLVKELANLEEQEKRFLSAVKKHTNSYTTPRKASMTEDQIQEAKAYPLEELFSKYTEIKKTGCNFVCRCPFHSENTPSCYIYTKSNTFYCFGCTEKGDGISFVQKIEDLPFIEAVQLIINL